MFGIPIYIIQLAISVLKATGAVNWAGALSMKAIVKVDQDLKDLKTYHAASDFPDCPPSLTNTSNIGPPP